MPKITLDEFKQIKGFVKIDITRELQLARASDSYLRYLLDFIGVTRGGGNMMCMITLLEYTEFVGHVYAQLNDKQNKYDAKQLPNVAEPNVAEQYDAFTLGFQQMVPSDYKKLPNSPSEIHNILRNSLIDFSKESPVNIAVGMLDNNFGSRFKTNASIAIDNNGEIWYFCIERYLNDLLVVFENLEKRLASSK